MDVAGLVYFLGRKSLIYPFSYKTEKNLLKLSGRNKKWGTFLSSSTSSSDDNWRKNFHQGKGKADSCFLSTISDEGQALSKGGRGTYFLCRCWVAEEFISCDLVVYNF